MQTIIPLKIFVSCVYYDESGEKFDELSLKTNGCLKKKENKHRILYKDGGEKNQIFTELIFCEGEASLIVNKTGDAECNMVFTPDKSHSFLYRLSNYSFDAEIYTHSLYNDMSENGGSITVVYSLMLGGQKQKISMKILADA